MKTYAARLITGLVIIIVGILFLLSNIDVLNIGYIVREWWPLIVIIGGVLVYINDTKNYLWSLFIIGIGVLLQIRELDIINVNPWQVFWPIVVIAVGFSVLFNRSTATHKADIKDGDSVTAILAGSNKQATSDDYKGTKVTAVLGGVELDLRQVKIKKEASISVFAFMGGVELYVPKDVIVRNQTTAILGGVEDSSRNDTTKNASVLYITGDVILGGIDIKN